MQPSPPSVRAESGRDRASPAVLAAAAGIVAALLISRREYEPVWDGRIYADCITVAAERFSPGALRCADHASHAYVGLAALVQRLSPGSYPLLLATNAVLLLVACIGFHRILRATFPAADQRLDRAILTAAFAVQPSFLAAVVQPGLDLALLPGFVWCIVFALERRWGWLVATGTALAFSKETGVLLYAVLLACLGAAALLRRGSARDRVRAVAGLVPLAAPGLVFVGYLLYRTTLPNETVLWYQGTTGAPILEQFLVPRLDLFQVNYALLLFVMNFAWILTAAVLADGFIGAVRSMHRLPARPVPGSDRAAVGLLTLLAGASAYALTRFTTFGHTRYFLTVVALLLIVAYASLLRLGLPAVLRRSVLTVYAACLLAATVRTVDPVSRWAYGTFPVGSHRMLHMTSITGECCALGHDQLAYSLEFTVLQRLIDEAAAVVVPTSSLLVVPDSASWTFIDPPWGTSRPLGHWIGATTRRVYEHREVAGGDVRPDSAFYLAVPFGDTERARRDLAPLYEFVEHTHARDGGYQVSLYRITRRQPRP